MNVSFVYLARCTTNRDHYRRRLYYLYRYYNRQQCLQPLSKVTNKANANALIGPAKNRGHF